MSKRFNFAWLFLHSILFSAFILLPILHAVSALDKQSARLLIQLHLSKHLLHLFRFVPLVWAKNFLNLSYLALVAVRFLVHLLLHLIGVFLLLRLNRVYMSHSFLHQRLFLVNYHPNHFWTGLLVQIPNFMYFPRFKVSQKFLAFFLVYWDWLNQLSLVVVCLKIQKKCLHQATLIHPNHLLAWS